MLFGKTNHAVMLPFLVFSALFYTKRAIILYVRGFLVRVKDSRSIKSDLLFVVLVNAQHSNDASRLVISLLEKLADDTAKKRRYIIRAHLL